MNYWVRPAVNHKKELVEQVIDNVCREFNVTYFDIRRRIRLKHIVEARSIIAFICHKKLGLTSTATGAIIERDHATVLSSCRKVQGFMDVDQEYRELINKFI